MEVRNENFNNRRKQLHRDIGRKLPPVILQFSLFLRVVETPESLGYNELCNGSCNEERNDFKNANPLTVIR